MKNGDIYRRRYKLQETLYIGHWCLSPLQSGHLVTLHKFSQLPSASLSYFLVSHWWSEIFSLSKVILVLGKARSHRAPNLGCWVTRGVESPGWFDVSPKNSAWDRMHELACCHDEAVNHQFPIAAAFWIIPIVSTEECSSLMQNLMQICCSTRSVILNVTATQYTCLLNDIYRPHWLVQWSHHCSLTCVPVQPPWLPGYIDVKQTVPVILTMAGLFPGRPCLYIKWIRRQNISQLKEIFRVKGSALQIRWIGKAYMNQIILNLCKLNGIFSFIYLSIAHI